MVVAEVVVVVMLIEIRADCCATRTASMADRIAASKSRDPVHQCSCGRVIIV